MVFEYRKDNQLLQAINKRLPELKKWYEEATDHWAEEDYVYRFYHYSFKVYWLQAYTKHGVEMFETIGKEIDQGLNKFYKTILKDGCDIVFNMEHNQDWLKWTRPILEAFWHTKYFVEMMIKYGKELTEAPDTLPSGWASVLYLYNMR